jgi:uncharacterized membrane protein
MQKQTFSIFKAIDFGFRMFARNIWLMIGLSLVIVFIQIGTDIVSGSIIKKSGLDSCFINHSPETTGESSISLNWGSIIRSSYQVTYTGWMACIKQHYLAMLLLFCLYLLVALLSYIFYMGWNRIALDLYDTGTSNLNRIFIVFPLIITYLMAGILYGAIILGGFILLVVPGIVWMIKYSFYDLIIIDTGCGPLEALSESGKLTYGHKWKLFLFGIVTYFFILISAFTIIVPLVLAYIFYLSRAYIYRSLQAIQHNNTILNTSQPNSHMS